MDYKPSPILCRSTPPNFTDYFPFLNKPEQEIFETTSSLDTDPPSPNPQFRASRSTRSGRATNDTDFLDGLPIRQWRKQESSVGPLNSIGDDYLDGFGQAGVSGRSEWPNWGLPKGMHLYTPWCQQLLRNARAGKTIRASDASRTQEQRVEDKENNNGQDDATPTDTSAGFAAPRWALVPRHMEEPEREYLAKRRKGLANVTFVGPDGAIAVAPVAGVAGEGMVAADGVPLIAEDQQIRRRPPQARRKPKPKRGPGRGKKKVTETGGEGVSASAEALAASQKGVGVMDGSAEENKGDAKADDHAEDGKHDHNEDDEGDDDEDAEDGDDNEGEEDDDDREEGEITTPPKDDTTSKAEATDLLNKTKHHSDDPPQDQNVSHENSKAKSPTPPPKSSKPESPSPPPPPPPKPRPADATSLGAPPIGLPPRPAVAGLGQAPSAANTKPNEKNDNSHEAPS